MRVGSRIRPSRNLGSVRIGEAVRSAKSIWDNRARKSVEEHVYEPQDHKTETHGRPADSCDLTSLNVYGIFLGERYYTLPLLRRIYRDIDCYRPSNHGVQQYWADTSP